MKIIYCDHAATTAVKREVLCSMIPYYTEKYGNPSSLYEMGRINKQAITNSRIQVAKAINAEAKEIYFTSCGSESDNLAIKGFCYANAEKGNHIITSKIEHPAVLNTCKSLERQGFKVTYLNVDNKGFVRLDELYNSVLSSTILISIMTANNEIGTIQPIKQIGEFAKARNIVFHTDAVQAIGNIKIDVKEMNIDMLSMSAHKFYGPKGVGALYVRNGIEIERIQDGGHQERNKRAGTENVAGIVGLGKAIEIANRNMERYNKKLLALRQRFITGIENAIGKENCRINGDLFKRLPGNVNISFKDIDSGLLLLELDKRGVCASGGSACSSQNTLPSHVLRSIGAEADWIDGTIRFSFGEENTIDDIDYLINVIYKIYMVNKRKNSL